MDKFRKTVENIWYYYKIPILIAVAVLAAGLYLGLQTASTPEPDYHIAIVRAMPLRDEERKEMEEAFMAAGQDVNGDGRVVVQIHTYYTDLSSSDPYADTVAALDADLIGHVSGIFLLEDVAVFQQITGNVLENVISHYSHGLFLGLRKGAPEEYQNLVENLF